MDYLVKDLKELSRRLMTEKGQNYLDTRMYLLSVMKSANQEELIDALPKLDYHELKYVVDKQFSIDVIPKKFRYTIPIWLQPNAYDLEKSRKKCYELAMNNEYLRVGIQLHRIYQIQ